MEPRTSGAGTHAIAHGGALGWIGGRAAARVAARRRDFMAGRAAAWRLPRAPAGCGGGAVRLGKVAAHGACAPKVRRRAHARQAVRLELRVAWRRAEGSAALKTAAALDALVSYPIVQPRSMREGTRQQLKTGYYSTAAARETDAMLPHSADRREAHPMLPRRRCTAGLCPQLVQQAAAKRQVGHAAE
mmetsp:Transcript_33171/g.69460  ORF Transcript_33171/g.69460 Transcript_33171/m.69460 type:complete len:188 (+) Transcript_33171:1571-2134(+)